MAEVTSDRHYEEKFQFQLWKLIKQHVEEHNVSYHTASQKVLPEFMKTIRYRDREFEEAAIAKRRQEMLELSELERKLQTIQEADEGVS